MRRALLAALALAILSAAPADAAESRKATWKLVALNGTATAKITNTSWFCRRTGGEGSYVTNASYATAFAMRRTRGSNIFGYGSRGPLIPFGSATPGFRQTTTTRVDWNYFDTSTGAERQCEPQPQPPCVGTETFDTKGLLIEEGSFEVRRRTRRKVAIGWPLIVHLPPGDCIIAPSVSELIRFATTMPVRKWKGRRITTKIDMSRTFRDLELYADAKYDVEITYRATAKLKRTRR